MTFTIHTVQDLLKKHLRVSSQQNDPGADRLFHKPDSCDS